MSLPVVDAFSAYWVAIKMATVISLFGIAIGYAYIEGGVKWRHIHEMYVSNQNIATAEAKSRWAAERAELERQVQSARKLADSVALEAKASDDAAERKIADILAQVITQPIDKTKSKMDADVVMRINQIVEAANK